MSTTRSATSRKAASKRGAAARAEAQGEPKTFHFNDLDLTLELPVELPGELMFDLYQAQQATHSHGAVKLIYTLLGEEQASRVRDAIAAKKLSVADTEPTLGKLFNEALREYALEPGESPASESS